jgi:hypothetical protein
VAGKATRLDRTGRQKLGVNDHGSEPAVTLDELIARESIRDLMSRYTMAGDRLRVDEFAAVFTEDGVLESEGVPQSDSFRFEGRTGIRQWLSRWTSDPAAGERTHAASFIRHHLATSQIEILSADDARARTYWTAYTDIGPDHCGLYVDRFRRVNGAWLIAHRRVRLDWRADGSLYTSAILNTRMPRS